MVQYLPDDHGILNAGNHLRTTTADPAGLNINVEHPFQSLSPAHRKVLGPIESSDRVIRKDFYILNMLQEGNRKFPN